MAAINIEPYTRLDNYQKEFEEIEASLTEQFMSKNKVLVADVPEGAIHIQKYAVSAAISEEIPDLTKHLIEDPDQVRLGMQVANVRYGSIEGRALCFPGGAIMSEEEYKWIAEHPDEKIPGNLFYILAEEAILTTGRFDCHYPDWKEKERAALERTISNNALREVREELGDDAASQISLEKIFDGARISTLATISFPSAEKSAEIAKKYDLEFDGKSINGVYTRVEEYFGLATTPYLDRIASMVKKNEETYRFDVLRLPEIVKRGWGAVKEPGAHNDIGEYDLRNPSTACAMVKTLDFCKELVIAQETYKEGARRSSKYGNNTL